MDAIHWAVGDGGVIATVAIVIIVTNDYEDIRKVTCPSKVRAMNAVLNQFLCPGCRGQIKLSDYGMKCNPCKVHYQFVPAE